VFGILPICTTGYQISRLEGFLCPDSYWISIYWKVRGLHLQTLCCGTVDLSYSNLNIDSSFLAFGHQPRLQGFLLVMVEYQISLLKATTPRNGVMIIFALVSNPYELKEV
jgi:hypothetical protein